MADWYGNARSNYVRIKDMDGLKASIGDFDIQMWERNGCVAFGGSDSNGGWPSQAMNDEGDCIDFDVSTHIVPYMEDGEVLVLIEVGSEKLRYVTGSALAYHSSGRFVSVCLDQIYSLAEVAFGVEAISLAEY